MRQISALARAAFVAAACLPAACRPPATGGIASASVPDSVMVRRDIEVLASERFEGRRTGTPGNDSAAAYLAARYATLRLQPAPDGGAGCGAGCATAYLRRFTATEPVRNGPPVVMPTQNLIGVIPGTDPTVANEYVMIGAHFDHLGRSTSGALDPDRGSEIRNGADDNASGTAAVLAQGKLLDAYGIQRFLQFHRDDARVAMCHGAKRPRPVMVGAGPPATVAAVVAAPQRAIGTASQQAQRGIAAEMRAGRSEEHTSELQSH